MCLSNFLLALVFKVMDEVVETIDAPRRMKHIVGPLWLVQLWLNTILANHINLKRENPNDIKLKIEGAQLTFLTPNKEFCTYESYNKYIKAFLGPSWLKQRFP